MEKEGLEGDNPEIIMRSLDSLGEYLKLCKGAASDDSSIFKYLTQCDHNIKSIFISGIKGLETVKTAKKTIFKPQTKEDLSKLRKEDHEEIVFETTGTNLRACLSHDKIDSRRTYSNDINEIYDVLGIEAARQSFIN